MLFVAYAATLKEIALICYQSPDYSHGLVLPFVSLYLFWDRKDELFSSRGRELAQASRGITSRQVLGLLLLLSGIMLLVLGDLSDLLFISWLSFFFSASGLLFLTFCRPRPEQIWPLLLLNFMAKPLPDSLVPRLFFPLQVFAARIGAFVLEVFGVPVYLKGNIIEIPGMKLMVEEACSGLRSLMALLCVAVIVVLSVNLRLAAKVIIVLLGLFLAIGLNVVRVSVSGILAHFAGPETAEGFFHEFSGLVVFVIGLILLYAAAILLKRGFRS